MNRRRFIQCAATGLFVPSTFAIPPFRRSIDRPRGLRIASSGGSSQVQITLFGCVSNPDDNSSNTTSPASLTPPASMQAGDCVMLFTQARGTDAEYDIHLTNEGGQSWIQLGFFKNTNTTIVLWVCRFNGTWSANPETEAYDTYPLSMVMPIFRGSGAGYVIDIDVMPSKGTFTAGSSPFTKTITGITTRTDGAVVVACWSTADANTWGSLTAGWSTLGSSQYRNSGGSKCSMALAYKVMATAGASGNVSLNEATLGGDAGATFILALSERVAPSGTTPSVDLYTEFENGSSGNPITKTILDNCTHPASPGGVWSLANTPGTSSSISTTAEKALRGSVSCGGTTYNDSGATRGFLHDQTYGDTPGYYQFTPTASKQVVSIGFWFRTSMAYLTYNVWAGMGFVSDDATEQYLAMGFSANTSGKHRFGIHTNTTATTNAEIYIKLLIDTWYWCSMLWDKNNAIAKGALFDENFNQLGLTLNIPLTTPGNVTILSLGCTGGGYAVETGKVVLIDDFVANYSGVFPLLSGS